MSQIQTIGATATGNGDDDRSFAPTRQSTGTSSSHLTQKSPAPKHVLTRVETGGDRTTARFEPTTARVRGSARLDPLLLERANEVLADIEHADPEAMSQAVETLRYVTCELWPSAEQASVYHQSILALAESAVRQTETISAGLASALRGAFKDLEQKLLSEQYVEVALSRFIDEGFTPMAPFSNVREADPATPNE